jgi:hypothetical protein
MVDKSKCISGLAYARKALAFLLIFLLSASSIWADEAETGLRRQLAWQIALEAVDFSPGIIDGAIGPKTRLTA